MCSSPLKSVASSSSTNRARSRPGIGAGTGASGCGRGGTWAWVSGIVVVVISTHVIKKQGLLSSRSVLQILGVILCGLSHVLVILSAAKSLVSFGYKTRFFAALRMTCMG